MIVSSCGQTRAAPGTSPNEDSYVADDSRRVYVVSDGVGRHSGGDVASRLAVDAFCRSLPPEAAGIPSRLKDSYRAVVRELFERGKSDPDRRDMCATLTALHLADGEYHFGHIGDSRLYRLRGSTLLRLTKDHSVAQEQLDAGAITEEQMQTHPNQKLLTRSLSASRDFALPEFGRGSTQAGDVFLVCTDGVNKVLLPKEIAAALSARADAAAACAALLDAVDRKGRKDDTTAIVIRIGG